MVNKELIKLFNDVNIHTFTESIINECKKSNIKNIFDFEKIDMFHIMHRTTNTETNWNIEILIPVINKNYLTINIKNNKLIVDYSIDPNVSDSTDSLFFKIKNSFVKEFNIPLEVDIDSIETKYIDGILLISSIKNYRNRDIVIKI